MRIYMYKFSPLWVIEKNIYRNRKEYIAEKKTYMKNKNKRIWIIYIFTCEMGKNKEK